MSDIAIRSFVAEDAPALARIYHRAVQEGAAPKYSGAQRHAWSPAPPTGADWAKRLGAADTLVAERDGQPVGFMSRVGAELDLAFVLPEERGRGTADALCEMLETRACADGIVALTTHASLMAEPFLARRGWQVTDRETVERHGVQLQRAAMVKALGRETAA